MAVIAVLAVTVLVLAMIGNQRQQMHAKRRRQEQRNQGTNPLLLEGSTPMAPPASLIPYPYDGGIMPTYAAPNAEQVLAARSLDPDGMHRLAMNFRVQQLRSTERTSIACAALNTLAQRPDLHGIDIDVRDINGLFGGHKGTRVSVSGR